MTDTWVSVYMKLNRKSDKRRLGLVNQDFMICKNEPAPLHVLIGLATKNIVEFYLSATDMSISEINTEIQEAVKYLAGCTVIEDVGPDDYGDASQQAYEERP